MQKLPHTYTASAQGGGEGGLRVETEEGFQFECFPPSHFGGPEGVQSPEYLLSEAMASCLVLTFRAIAKASGLDWETRSSGRDALAEEAPGPACPAGWWP